MGRAGDDDKPVESDAAKKIQEVIRARNEKRIQEKAAKKVQVCSPRAGAARRNEPSFDGDTGRAGDNAKPTDSDAAKKIQGVIRARNEKRLQEKAAKKIQGVLRNRRHGHAGRRATVADQPAAPVSPRGGRRATTVPRGASVAAAPELVSNGRDPAMMRKLYSDARRAFTSETLSDEGGSALQKASRAILKAAEGAVRQRSVVGVLAQFGLARQRADASEAQENTEFDSSELLGSMLGQDCDDEDDAISAVTFFEHFQEKLSQVEAQDIGEQLKTVAARMTVTVDAFTSLRLSLQHALDSTEDMQRQFALQMQEALDLSNLLRLDVDTMQKKLTTVLVEPNSESESTGFPQKRRSKDEADGVSPSASLAGAEDASTSPVGARASFRRDRPAGTKFGNLVDLASGKTSQGEAANTNTQHWRSAVLHVKQITCTRPLRLLMEDANELTAMSRDAKMPGLDLACLDLASGFRESLAESERMTAVLSQKYAVAFDEEKTKDEDENDEMYAGVRDDKNRDKDADEENQEARNIESPRRVLVLDPDESSPLAGADVFDLTRTSNVPDVAGAASNGRLFTGSTFEGGGGGGGDASSLRAVLAPIEPRRSSKGLRMRNRISLRPKNGVEGAAELASAAVAPTRASATTEASSFHVTAAAELRALWHSRVVGAMSKQQEEDRLEYVGSGGQIPMHVDTTLQAQASSAASDAGWYPSEARRRQRRQAQGFSSEPLAAVQELRPSSLTFSRARTDPQSTAKDISVARMGLDSIEVVRDHRRRLANGQVDVFRTRPFIPERPRGENPKPFLPFGRPMSRTTPLTPRTARLRFLPPVDAVVNLDVAVGSRLSDPSRCSVRSEMELDSDGSLLKNGSRRDPYLAAMWRRRGGLVSVDA